MMLLNHARSHKAPLQIVGAVVFVTVLISLLYNHLDFYQTPSRPTQPIAVVPAPQDPDEILRNGYIRDIFKPSQKPDAPNFKPWGAFEWKLKNGVAPKWKKPLGENLCIIDLDNRGFDKAGELFGPTTMTWNNATQVHGLSLGVLNHWLYAKIHGYKYYYIEIGTYSDRRASWKKPPVMSEILKDHDACVYLDSDAIFHHLDLPFEWLMNYWDVHPETNSLALAVDPLSEKNKDKFGKVFLNTGFIIAQNNPKTFEIMDAWEDCANDGGVHPDCVSFRTNGPGQVTDQGGFGTFIRYDYPEDIKELPCAEANGFPEAQCDCFGHFIKHLWTGKTDWIKIAVGEQIPGKFLELFHKQYLEEKKDFYFTEEQLMAGKTHKTIPEPTVDQPAK